MKKVRKNKGFTLAEMLIVVAIIGVLLAVAIPNVISYYRSLKLTELDDSARTIFVAAQNRLTAMKSAGENLNALCSGNITVALASGGSANVGTVTDSDKLDALVLGGSIEAQLHDNHYVVEINPKTGAVFAVWYWEKEDYTYPKASYNVDEMTRDKRLEAGTMVGYYGGDPIDRPEFQQTPFPSSVKVTNGEELVLTITVPEQGLGASVDITAKVTISAGGVTVPIVPDALGDPGVVLCHDTTARTYTGRIALDTLKSTYTNAAPTWSTPWDFGKPFKDWVRGSAITPGMNFDIEVKVCVDGGELSAAIRLLRGREQPL